MLLTPQPPQTASHRSRRRGSGTVRIDLGSAGGTPPASPMSRNALSGRGESLADCTSAGGSCWFRPLRLPHFLLTSHGFLFGLAASTDLDPLRSVRSRLSSVSSMTLPCFFIKAGDGIELSDDCRTAHGLCCVCGSVSSPSALLTTHHLVCLQATMIIRVVWPSAIRPCPAAATSSRWCWTSSPPTT